MPSLTPRGDQQVGVGVAVGGRWEEEVCTGHSKGSNIRGIITGYVTTEIHSVTGSFKIPIISLYLAIITQNEKLLERTKSHNNLLWSSEEGY